jgi:glycosidase
MYKRLLLIALLGLGLMQSCSTDKKSETVEQVSPADLVLPFPERARDMNIYEVNIRQYTTEGTFKAFMEHLPRLKKMGVDILWFMPIQPIGEEKRKGSLGSYYSIQDYTDINPEFGTLEDFKAIVNKAHELDMLVILDWVANHTSWDAEWIDNDGWYTLDSMGNMVSPYDWTDVADLNYDNQDMRAAMIEAMKYWVEEADIDGFRCDVAHEVPMDFWNTAKSDLNEVKDLFMLAEADEPVMHDTAFHMTYGWEFHHITNKIAKGEMNADSIEAFLKKDLERYGPEAFRMNFTSNHDENSWNGTVYERYGAGYKAFAVLVSTVQGMPLIYSGQEAGLDRRLEFFEKDSIDWSNITLKSFYTKLLKLKKENPALWNGAYGAPAERINIDNTENIFAFVRKNDSNLVAVMINLSGESQSFTIAEESLSGIFMDYFSGREYDVSSDQPIELAPWDYRVFTVNTENI